MIIYSVTLVELGSVGEESRDPEGYYKHKSKAIKEGERFVKEVTWKFARYKYVIDEIKVNEKE